MFCHILFEKKKYFEGSVTEVQYIVICTDIIIMTGIVPTCINIILISNVFFITFNMWYMGIRMSKDQNKCTAALSYH